MARARHFAASRMLMWAFLVSYLNQHNLSWQTIKDQIRSEKVKDKGVLIARDRFRQYINY